jgi:hypothetical protein
MKQINKEKMMKEERINNETKKRIKEEIMESKVTKMKAE